LSALSFSTSTFISSIISVSFVSAKGKGLGKISIGSFFTGFAYIMGSTMTVVFKGLGSIMTVAFSGFGSAI
jgi:hypothetical protein